jgi:hypothetical protein
MCIKIMRALFTVLIAVSLALAVRAEPASTEDGVSEVVAHIMKTLAGGTLLVTSPPNNTKPVSGPLVPYLGGYNIAQSQLSSQCSAITPYGWLAVPELLKWLDYKDAFMRFIAARSLERITGLHPAFDHLATPHQAVNGDSRWFDNAKNVWSKWYEDLAHKKKPNA